MIDKLKANDRKAFYELVALYKDSVINTCYRFLLNKEDAEDVSQDVFVAIYQSIETFRGDAQLSTWIYRITVTKCLDEIKKRKRLKRFALISKMLHIDEVSHWISGGVLSDTNLHEEQIWKEVATVLNTLPENQRVAYTLSKMDGFSNKEIAAIMNTTTVAVESLVYRANKKITVKLITLLNK